MWSARSRTAFGHSFASLLIRDHRYTVVEIAEQMGHAPTETLKTYAHVIAEHRSRPSVLAEELVAAARAEALGEADTRETGESIPPSFD